MRKNPLPFTNEMIVIPVQMNISKIIHKSERLHSYSETRHIVEQI